MSPHVFLWIFKLISILLILFTTVLGAIAGLRIFSPNLSHAHSHSHPQANSLLFHTSICFTSFVFISVSLIHLLPDSLTSLTSLSLSHPFSSSHSQYLLLFSLATVGVLFAELVEYYSQSLLRCESHHHHGDDSEDVSVVVNDHKHNHDHECDGKHKHESKQCDSFKDLSIDSPLLDNANVSRNATMQCDKKDMCIPHEHSLIHLEIHQRDESTSVSSMDDSNEKENTSLVMVILLSFHSFVAGIALGSSTSSKAVLVLLIAIVAHKWAEALAVCYELVGHSVGRSEVSIFRMLGLYSLMTPLGVVIAAVSTGFMNQGAATLVQAVVTAFTAGVFMYVGIEHLDASKVYRGKWSMGGKAGAQFGAVALMLAVAIWE